MTIKSGSLEGVLQGKINIDAPSKAVVSPTATVDTTFVNMITVRNRAEFAGTKALTEILLNLASATSESNKATELLIIKNAVALAPLVYQYRNQQNDIALISYTNSAIDITQGEIVEALSFFNDSGPINLRELNQFLFSGESLTIAMRVSASPASVVGASLSWFEDK